MTTGQRERIVYRVVVRGAHSGSFLPAFGVGSGLDDPALGLALNRVVKGPPSFRASRRTVIGLVVAEDEDHGDHRTQRRTTSEDTGRRHYRTIRGRALIPTIFLRLPTKKTG